MFCQKCGTKNEDVARFCANCGEALELGSGKGTAQNSMSGASVESSSDSVNGGYVQSAQSYAPVEENPMQDDSVVDGGAAVAVAAISPEKMKKLITRAIIAVVAIVIIVLGISLVSKLFGSKVNYKKTPLIYVKENDTIMVDAKAKGKGYEASDDYGGGRVRVTEDGKYIFYAAQQDPMGGFDLYYRKASDKKSEGKKLDSGVVNFKISDKGDFVVYVTNSNQLRFHNLKDDRKIDSNVDSSEFYISNDEKYIIYETSDSQKDLYVCKTNMKSDPEKVEKGIQSWKLKIDEKTGRYIYDGEFYIKKDDNLFYKKVGKDKVKVLSDVGVYDYIGETLFATETDKEAVTYESVVNDDCADEDEDALYEYDYDDEEYQAAKYRSYIRDYYENEESEKNSYAVYKINGKKAKKLDEDFNNVDLSRQLLYKGAGTGGVINLSDIKTEEDYNAAREKLNLIFRSGLVVDGTPYVIKEKGDIIELVGIEEDAASIAISEDEKFVFCLEDAKVKDSENSSQTVYTLNRYKITSKGAKSKETVTEDVLSYSLADAGFAIVYTADGNSKNLGVFDKKYREVAEDVYDEYFDSELLGDTIYYVEDYDQNKNEGTLVRYTVGKKPVTVDDNVYLGTDIIIKSDKECYYIKDYSSTKAYGDLYYNKNKKSKFIDEEVTDILVGGAHAVFS